MEKEKYLIFKIEKQIYKLQKYYIFYNDEKYNCIKYKNINEIKMQTVEPSNYHNLIYFNYQNYMDSDRLVYFILVRFLNADRDLDFSVVKANLAYLGGSNMSNYQNYFNDLMYLRFGYIIKCKEMKIVNYKKMNGLCIKLLIFYVLMFMDDLNIYEKENMQRIYKMNAKKLFTFIERLKLKKFGLTTASS